MQYDIELQDVFNILKNENNLISRIDLRKAAVCLFLVQPSDLEPGKALKGSDATTLAIEHKITTYSDPLLAYNDFALFFQEFLAIRPKSNECDTLYRFLGGDPGNQDKTNHIAQKNFEVLLKSLSLKPSDVFVQGDEFDLDTFKYYMKKVN